MDVVLSSVMCCCEAQDLFTLSGLCKETRSIFTSKSFWKARFALLGIKHEEPSLQVYLRCLRLEDKFLDEGTGLLFYSEIDLDVLCNTSSLIPKMGSYILSGYLVIEFREGKYNISNMKEPYLSGLSKEEALNVLLKLCPRG